MDLEDMGKIDQHKTKHNKQSTAKLYVTVEIVLTHWSQGKMAAIFQMTFSNGFSWMKNIWILIKISLKFVHRGSINNIPALV